MNDFLNNTAALVSSWSAIIFLSFALGLLIQNRRLKKKNAWEKEQHREELFCVIDRRNHGLADAISERDRMARAKEDMKILVDHSLEWAQEAEELRQKSAEAAALEIAQLRKQLDLTQAANDSHIRLLKEAEHRNLVLTRLASRVYRIFRTFKNDNSKIEKHLAFLEKPKKRKSRAKAAV